MGDFEKDLKSIERKLPLVVIGLGNGLLKDDAVGLQVVEQLTDEDTTGVADRYVLELGGIRLLTYLAGYKRAILVDSYLCHDRAPGEYFWVDLEQLKVGQRAIGVHDVSVPQAMQMGRGIGLVLPEKVEVLAVAAREVFTLEEKLTAEVEAQVPAIISSLRKRIAEIRAELGG